MRKYRQPLPRNRLRVVLLFALDGLHARRVRSPSRSCAAGLLDLIENRSHNPSHHTSLHGPPVRFMRHVFVERVRELGDGKGLQPDSSGAGERGQKDAVAAEN